MQKIDRTRRKRRYLVLSFFVPFGVMPVSYTHLTLPTNSRV